MSQVPAAPATRRATSAHRLAVALLATCALLLLSAASAGATTAQLSKAFGGPILPGTACSPTATADNTQAAAYSDFCVAFASNNGDGSNPQAQVSNSDLKSEVIDTPQGFAGDASSYPTCSDAQFGPLMADVNTAGDMNADSCPA